MKKLMDFQIKKKYTLEDKRCLKYSYLENYFNLKDKNNSIIKTSPTLNNFLNY